MSNVSNPLTHWLGYCNFGFLDVTERKIQTNQVSRCLLSSNGIVYVLVGLVMGTSNN